MKVCVIEACGRKSTYATGMCGTHEARRKAGRPLDVPIGQLLERKPKRPCSVDGCEVSVAAKGMCGTHYKRKRDGRDLHAPVNPRVPGGVKCTVSGCGRKGTSYGLCSTHAYQRDIGVEVGPRRALRGASLTERLEFYSAPPNENGCRLWTGGVNRDSYPIIYTGSNTSAMAHRVAYEVGSGETLAPGEVIHHKCAVRECIEFTHLQKVTGSENTAEMFERNAYIRRIAELEALLLEHGISV